MPMFYNGYTMQACSLSLPLFLFLASYIAILSSLHIVIMTLSLTAHHDKWVSVSESECINLLKLQSGLILSKITSPAFCSVIDLYSCPFKLD